MYRYLWYYLPGPTWLKLVELLVLLAAVFFLLMEVVFPWLSPLMPYTDDEVG